MNGRVRLAGLLHSPASGTGHSSACECRQGTLLTETKECWQRWRPAMARLRVLSQLLAYNSFLLAYSRVYGVGDPVQHLAVPLRGDPIGADLQIPQAQPSLQR